MNEAERLVEMAMENDEVPSTPDPDSPAARAEAGEDISKMSAVDKWKGALETFRKLREKEREKERVMDELEYSLTYRHQLAIKGLHPEEVANTIRRSHDHVPEWQWRPRLKRKGDPRWKEASDGDIIGVKTKDGETVLFDEWIKPTMPRKRS